MIPSLYAMEPLLPADPDGELAALAVRVIRSSAALGGQLSPPTRAGVARLLRTMNSFYSNLIEGHRTLPADIERALRSRYDRDAGRRALQQESRAHVEVQEWMEARLAERPEVDVCGVEFLRGLHREFYLRMPEEFRRLDDPSGAPVAVEPGALRQREVVVGRHLPPPPGVLEEFLARFAAAYAPGKLSEIQKVIAAGASHHRLVWIHPFLDGNGRVARLFTQAYLTRAGIEGQGLWAASRGMARRRDDYLAALAAADSPRRGDLDGRGALSDETLRGFCRFFLELALDQITFMAGLLELEGFERRVAAYAARQAEMGRLRPEAGRLLREVLVRGQLARGEAPRFLGLRERTARDAVRELLAQRLLVSPSPKGPLRMGFPISALGYYFPMLFPEGAEGDI